MHATDVLAYSGDADLWCEDCARARFGGTDPDNHDHEGNEVGAVFASDEWDTPYHCAGCGAFLELPLSGYGRAYVLEAVIEALASGRESVAVSEWAPFYDVPADLEPDAWADRFDIIRGAYWACADYHNGQASRGYRHLSKLGRHYRPGPLEKSSTLEGDSLAAYVRVAVSLLKSR